MANLTLGRGAELHVGRQPARTYRDALRARGVAIEEWDAVRALEPLLARAEPVERELSPELWAVVDPHGLRVSARVVRHGVHAWILALAVRDAEDATLDGAECTRAAIEQYVRARGATLEQAQRELRIVCHLATRVDAAVTPERWRARSSAEGIDVSLAVQRVDREGTPLVVAANARSKK